MLNSHPIKGELVKLAQGTVIYKKTRASNNLEIDLVFAEKVEKPSIAIYIEQFNDSVSKVVLGEDIRYVPTEWLYEVKV